MSICSSRSSFTRPMTCRYGRPAGSSAGRKRSRREAARPRRGTTPSARLSSRASTATAPSRHARRRSSRRSRPPGRERTWMNIARASPRVRSNQFRSPLGVLLAESVELATILLTDLVGSTRLATSVGPVRADELREEHFELLRDAIASSGGREVKNTGDGLMVAFSSASAAVECAVAVQQLFERRYRDAEQALHVRVGLGRASRRSRTATTSGCPRSRRRGCARRRRRMGFWSRAG